ncbi:MAG: FKBP-type peptidyl-prolyl cis-trans isomerase [Verrucomicrobiae bacterium]|nr:FKBP-type peptidyl-prolyl cis-trans isomerase [Verrucomicrobiae bacterium]
MMSDKNSQESVKLETADEQASYSIGVDIGRNLKRSTEGLTLSELQAGLQDGFQSETNLMTDEAMQKVIMNYRTELIARRQAKQKIQATNNLAKAEAFLKENAKKEGIVTLPSGLQYQVLKEGTGPKPASTNVVTTEYVGTLIDGTEFDSSIKRGEPATFPVSGVIRGWTEALQLMKVGSKWKLFIPPNLAYGESGAGDKIEPNSALIFEVELLDIKGQEKDQNKDQKESKKQK